MLVDLVTLEHANGSVLVELGYTRQQILRFFDEHFVDEVHEEVDCELGKVMNHLQLHIIYVCDRIGSDEDQARKRVEFGQQQNEPHD